MAIRPDYFIKEKQEHVSAVPSARKSLGEYKPILKYGKRTEVMSQARSHTVDRYRTHERGQTFSSRDEAIAYAEKIKQFRINECVERAKKYGFNI